MNVNQPSRYKIGDCIWLKVGEHPFWPAYVVDHTDEQYASNADIQSQRQSSDQLLGHFYNDDSVSWFSPSSSRVRSFSLEDSRLAKGSLKKHFKDDALRQAIQSAKKDCIASLHYHHKKETKKKRKKNKHRLSSPRTNEGYDSEAEPAPFDNVDPFSKYYYNTRIPKKVRRKRDYRDLSDGEYHVISYGRVVKGMYCDDEDYIYPIGFSSVLKYEGVCYLLKTRAEEGSLYPVYDISRMGGEKFSSTSISKAFLGASGLEKEVVKEMKLRGLFGFDDKWVVYSKGATEYCMRNKRILFIRENYLNKKVVKEKKESAVRSLSSVVMERRKRERERERKEKLKEKLFFERKRKQLMRKSEGERTQAAGVTERKRERSPKREAKTKIKPGATWRKKFTKTSRNVAERGSGKRKEHPTKDRQMMKRRKLE